MASFFTICLLLIQVTCSFLQLSKANRATDDSSGQLQTYIIQLRSPEDISHHLSATREREAWYQSLLSEIVSSGDKPSTRLVHSYHHVFAGFAARLSPAEFEALRKTEAVLSAWPEGIMYPATTHSPKFMGLTREAGIWSDANYGSEIVIAVLDTGINPDGHVSFSNPSGIKVIDAQSFVDGESVADANGHGSHVAGTVAGYFVGGANVSGRGAGVASGTAPLAKLAIYKVCGISSAGLTQCPDSSILRGIEAAIADGRVDVISASLGSRIAGKGLDQSSLAIGAFSALKKGIFFSVAASNGGRGGGSTISNEAPWYLTVGASTTDRTITGAGETLYGDLDAPTVAAFSSRGPTIVARGIMKPDIIGPGVDIIAAGHTGKESFAIKNGTSMATPHLSGAAALVKKLHPDWSPAYIKSALMTTAYRTNGRKSPILDGSTRKYASTDVMGAGHVDVTRAADPGIVLDIQPDDYIPYLCFLGDYSSQQVSAIVSSPVDCATAGKTPGSALNLPSIWIDIRAAGSARVSRTATQVDAPAETYVSSITYYEPGKINIAVDPTNLVFPGYKTNVTFQVTITRISSQPLGERVSAFLDFISASHRVSIPIMVVI